VTAKEGVNKSNHPIQSPLLLVTEPRTRDNMLTDKHGDGRIFCNSSLGKRQKKLMSLVGGKMS
jgi:hypothetical protein